MTAQYASCGKPAALEGAVFLERLKRVCGAGGVIAAIETDPRAEDQPVGANGQRREFGQRAHPWIFRSARRKSSRSSFRAIVKTEEKSMSCLLHFEVGHIDVGAAEQVYRPRFFTGVYFDQHTGAVATGIKAVFL